MTTLLKFGGECGTTSCGTTSTNPGVQAYLAAYRLEASLSSHLKNAANDVTAAGSQIVNAAEGFIKSMHQGK